MNKRRWIIAGGAVLVVVAAGVGLFLTGANSFAPRSAPTPTSDAALLIPKGMVAIAFPLDKMGRRMSIGDCQTTTIKLHQEHPDQDVAGWAWNWDVPPNNYTTPPAPQSTGVCYSLSSKELAERIDKEQQWQSQGASADKLGGYYAAVPK